MATLFTKIIDGELPGRFVWSDDVAVGFLTIAPIRPGHTLVVPRAEIDEFTNADDDTLAHLTTVAKAIGAAQKQAWSAPRAGLIVAGFEVPHLHVHVLPIWGEGDLTFANARTDTPEPEMDAAAEKLRAALAATGHQDHVPAEVSTLG